ncbi:MAG: GNAT family N-acetyltransferase [Saprospiraceae bacterium]|nr:GNAT family N-acetyltransferase [Saprospiraceae bacterium]
MKILQARNTDATRIATLFKLATDAMIAAGINQWNYTYPLLEHVMEDIRNQSCFVFKEEGEILATITLDDKQDAQYANVRWQHPGSKALIIHRLAVLPSAQGRKLGKQMCLFAEDFAGKNGFEVIRLDAYSKNPVSLRLYRSLGIIRSTVFVIFTKILYPFTVLRRRCNKVHSFNTPISTIRIQCCYIIYSDPTM